MGDTRLELGKRKLVVLGLPWDVDTNGLKQYMSKFGTLDDVVVMKERRSGRSRGFGYATFSTNESAEKALGSNHILNGRLLEVKVATPKEEMKSSSKKITRIFVAKIPSKVSEEEFKKYFETFGTITDIYMPKDSGAKTHRGIGFITFEDAESVSKILAKSHEIGGATVAVDEATPKDEGGKSYGKNDYAGRYYDSNMSGAYGAYSPYVAAGMGGSRYGGGGYGTSSYGAYDYAGSAYGSGGEYGPGRWSSGSAWSGASPSNGMLSAGGVTNSSRYSGYMSGGSQGALGSGVTKGKVFVGKLPSEISAEDLRGYFGNFGRVMDVYLPKDSIRNGHRGFAFVTFSEEGPAERVSRRSHDLLGHQILVQRAGPSDEAGLGEAYSGTGGARMFGGSTGPTYTESSYKSSLDYYDSWNGAYGGGGYDGGVGPTMGGERASRTDMRYRPY